MRAYVNRPWETLLRPESPGPECDRLHRQSPRHSGDQSPVTRGSDIRAAVELQIEGVLDGVCVVDYPLAPIRTERGAAVDGIRITKSGVPLFGGGYDSEDPFGWYRPDGSWDDTGFITVRGGTQDPWSGFEVGRKRHLGVCPGTGAGEPGQLGDVRFDTALHRFRGIGRGLPHDHVLPPALL